MKSYARSNLCKWNLGISGYLVSDAKFPYTVELLVHLKVNISRLHLYSLPSTNKKKSLPYNATHFLPFLFILFEVLVDVGDSQQYSSP